ncbi:hypothetical protein [Paraburkholderia sp.]|uniref:hypothetical protein n=1 Tax=Paraburkholderia sp. TaxID=1926495 RepID=UPI002B46F83D|nr:hypothetical protein [Paraburkholderia sp.]
MQRSDAPLIGLGNGILQACRVKTPATAFWAKKPRAFNDAAPDPQVNDVTAKSQTNPHGFREISLSALNRKFNDLGH